MNKIMYLNDHLPAGFESQWNHFVETLNPAKVRPLLLDFNQAYTFIPPWTNLEMKLRSQGLIPLDKITALISDIEQFVILSFMQHNHELYSSHLKNKVVIISPLSEYSNRKLEKTNLFLLNPASLGRSFYDIYNLEFASKLMGFELSNKVQVVIGPLNPLLHEKLPAKINLQTLS